MESIVHRYFYRLGGGFLGMPINATMQAVAAHSLGPANLGIYNFIVGFFRDIISLADSGLGEAHYRKLCSTNKDSASWMAFFWRVVGGVVLILLLGSAGAWMLGAGRWLWPEQSMLTVLGGLGIAAATWMVSLIGKAADAWGYTRVTELARLWNRLVILVLIGGLAWFGWLGLQEYFLAQLIALLSLALIWTVEMRRRGRAAVVWPTLRAQGEEAGHLRELVTFTGPLLVYSLIGMLAGQYDRWILLRSAGSVEMGYFAAGQQLGAMCFVFTSALTQLLLGEYARAVAQKAQRRLRWLFLRSVSSLYVVASYLGVFCAVNAAVVVRCFAGDRFIPGAMTVALLCLYPLHQTYGQLSGGLYLARGATKEYANIGNATMVFGMIVTTVCVLPDFLDLGSLGLAVKMVLTQLLLVNIQLYRNAQLLKLSFRRLLGNQLAIVGAFAVVAILTSEGVKFLHLSGPWPQFLVSGFIYTLGAVAMTLIFDLGGLRRWLRRNTPARFAAIWL